MTKSQLIARGSPLADTREDHVEQLPDYVPPACPKWLGRIGRKEFRRVLAILEKQRHVTVLFVATFWINLYEFSTTKVQDVVTSTSGVIQKSMKAFMPYHGAVLVYPQR